MLRLFLGLAIPLALTAQTPVPAGTTAAPSTPARPLAIAEQIAAAVLPIPAEFRASATVLGYGDDLVLRELRKGDGAYVCLASDPRAARFHVACYHRSLEPFMARGRELRANRVAQDQVDSVRFAEARAGKLKLPEGPAALYSLTGPLGSYDPATQTASGARPLFVVYIPYATAESTGLTAKPVQGAPWIMYPGTPKAHIMFVPSM